MVAAKPLASSELERLSAALASEALPEAMPLDAVQGAFYAMASGPAAFPPLDRWLSWLIGGNAGWQDDAQRIDVESLLQRFAAASAREIIEEEDPLPVILFDDDSGKPDHATWCHGYLDGVDQCEPSWRSFSDDDAVDELLLPIEVLALGRAAESTPIEGIDDVATFARGARQDLAAILLDIRQYWFDLRTSRVPVRREAPRVGRNDRCPCGSGRKFKQCHGAA